ncbi:MAG: metallophosphoesterase family protein [Planctomycetaceae bacterium]|nr:metallophosphoesterase family protein [Planctomycetaceae bacterium]
MALTCLFLFESCGFGQESPALTTPEPIVPTISLTDYYAPTLMPDRIVMSLADDPCTTRGINWRTSTEVTTAYAEVAEAQAGPLFVAHSKRLAATTELVSADSVSAHFHSITLSDLKPSTAYVYRVGDGSNWSEWFQFQTTSREPTGFSFIYFGDAQNQIRSMWSRVIREAYRDAPRAAFILHAGDLINKAESDSEWAEWFAAGAWLHAMTPTICVPGNHEYAKNEDDSRRLSGLWRPSFHLPINGPPGLEETCYTLVYQNMRLIALNSNTQLAEQANWLEQVLATNQSPWVVCTFHHPVYSTGKQRDNAALRTAWKPLFDKYKVDLVLTGHDHTYGRTGFEVPSVLTVEVAGQDVAISNQSEVNLPTGVQAMDAAGTIYVVSVSGPKMYDHSRMEFMRRIGEDTQLYQVISIEGDRLRFEAKTAIGELYDAFELHKTAPGQINRLVEIPASIPQNLRPTPPPTADASPEAK